MAAKPTTITELHPTWPAEQETSDDHHLSGIVEGHEALAEAQSGLTDLPSVRVTRGWGIIPADS